MVILNEVVEAASTFDPRYDVFLSFRGEDTRLNFTDHLYNALKSAGLETFLDDEEIQTGKPLKPELKSAIKASRASVIVLSKNYAYSTWCLEELVLILEQNKKSNQIVIPIFYNVEPTHVRKQQSSFGEAMKEHKLKVEAKKIEMWKDALTEVSNLKGKDAKGRYETEFIKEIVNDIYNELGGSLRITAPPLLVGIKHHIERVSSWLTDGSSHTADILTICGMGGIGKTSLAKYVYKVYSHEYTSWSFVGDISRHAKNNQGLLDLQKQLYGDISKRNLTRDVDVSEYTSRIQNTLANIKVLLVLDDVDSLHQLDALLGKKGFHPGSKIIITTRDASLIESCELFKIKIESKHTKCVLKPLSPSASMELLCHHAFACNHPTKGYEEVSKEVGTYCDGLPLALELVAKSLYNKHVDEWKSYIDKLKKEPISSITKVLQMSFDSLPFENDKDVFKDIACFFVGIDGDLTETILNACYDINTKSSFRTLINGGLLSIEWNNKLMMHQLVQEMGRHLVRQESPKKPWKRTRLWCHEESLHVLKRKKGKKDILGLVLDMKMLDRKKMYGSFELETDSLSNMDELKLLQLNYVHLNGFFVKFPKELRWLCMHGFPLKSIQLNFSMENLVALDMSYSNIESFDTSNNQKLVESCSKDKQLLGSLKILDISFCEQLRSVGGFFELPTLERLILKNCISLTDLCESVEKCEALVHIDLSYCYKLKLPLVSLGKIKNVQTLLLDGCNLYESQVEVIPFDLKHIEFPLPNSLRSLSLANSNLSNESFPSDWRCLSMLEALYLGNNPIVSMPNCVRTLPKLQKLNMDYCEMLRAIEHPPHTLRELSIFSSFSPSRDDYNTSLREIRFKREMSPLKLFGVRGLLSDSSFEIEGMMKIQDMAGVEENVLQSLGWKNLDFIEEGHLGSKPSGRQIINHPTQIYYEFGIFSTFYKGKEMPYWITCKRKGPSISFTIPSSPNNLRGFNFCYVERSSNNTFHLPMIKINNITKSHTWIYKHYIDLMKLNGTYASFLSHWMFGPNEVEGDDHITISVGFGNTEECGVGLVYEEDGKIEEDEDDVLGYYKSWNHIIGGDLLSFQLTTGEYFLHHMQFTRTFTKTYEAYRPYIEYRATFKE